MAKTYKYDIKTIKETDSFSSTYLLGDSIKEAEELLIKFSVYINNVTRAYSESTNIDRGDLFGDAVIALGKAKKDFDPKKSGEFTPYAKFIIVDAMNECVRKNKAIISTPVYISKAHKIIIRIKSLISNYTEMFEEIILDEKFDKFKIPPSVKNTILYNKELLNKASKRINITLVELINRAEFLPLITQENNIKKVTNNEELILTRLIVAEIFAVLNKNETIIAELIMNDKNISDICKILDRSNDWVKNRIKDIKSKAKQMLLKG